MSGIAVTLRAQVSSLRRGSVTIVTDGCAKRTTFFVLVLTASEEFTGTSPIAPEIPDM
jgi:hypothetical protein